MSKIVCNESDFDLRESRSDLSEDLSESSSLATESAPNIAKKSCEQIYRLSGEFTFPNPSLKYDVNFLHFPSVHCSAEEKSFSMLFPMTSSKLRSYLQPILRIEACDLTTGNLNAKCEIKVSDLISPLCDNVEQGGELPLERSLEKWGQLLDDRGKALSTIKANLKLSCLGPKVSGDTFVNTFQADGNKDWTLVGEEERKETTKYPKENGTLPNLQKDSPAKHENLYDEYNAVINGHNLSLKIMKTASGKRMGKDRFMDQKDNKVIFQVPSHQKLSEEGFMTKKHKITSEDLVNGEKLRQIAVTEKTDPTGDADSFSIVIGKSSKEGRVELKLTAPKPKIAEDFKKPARDSSTQTDLVQTGKKVKITK